jgi:hypothetical protein
MADLNLTLKTAAVKAIFVQIFGFEPVTNLTDTYAEFSFTPEQQVVLRNWMDKQLASQPGELRFNLAPVLTPWIIKKALPYVAAAVGTGYAIGNRRNKK